MLSSGRLRADEDNDNDDDDAGPNLSVKIWHTIQLVSNRQNIKQTSNIVPSATP